MSLTRILVSLALVLTLAWTGAARPPDPYQKIDKQADAQALFNEVTRWLTTNLGMHINRPIALHLVTGEEMDAIFKSSPYKGAEVGLHTFRDGKHQIYVMTGWNRDYCGGVMAHETTHGWQMETCPGQDQAVVEGFACWVEQAYYDSIGAYVLSERVREQADPVYGVGIKAMLALEDKVGKKNMVATIQNVRTLAEVAAVPPRKKK